MKNKIVAIIAMVLVLSVISIGCVLHPNYYNKKNQSTTDNYTATEYTDEQLRDIEQRIDNQSVAFTSNDKVNDMIAAYDAETPPTMEMNWIQGVKFGFALSNGDRAEFPIRVHCGSDKDRLFNVVAEPSIETKVYDEWEPLPVELVEWISIQDNVLNMKANETVDVIIVMQAPLTIEEQYKGHKYEFRVRFKHQASENQTWINSARCFVEIN